MPDHPINRFPIPKIDEMPDDIRERILAVQKKSEFVPSTEYIFNIRSSAKSILC